MRFGKFELGTRRPLGEGKERRSFVNPDDDNKVIVEFKEIKKETPRQLKGRFYLTKIAHLLLPDNVPDVYQAGEASDGTQSIDAQRITHTPEHTALQEARKSGADENAARDAMIQKMGAEISELDMELERIGLGFNIDGNVGNYSRSEAGTVHYLESFKPWDIDPNTSEIIELFDTEDMRAAIAEMSDEATRETCERYLERLSDLVEEERSELQKQKEASPNPEREAGALENLLAAFEEAYPLDELHAITTEEDAKRSELRTSAHKALTPMFKQLSALGKTAIAPDRYAELSERYAKVTRAVGTINRGVVDHTR